MFCPIILDQKCLRYCTWKMWLIHICLVLDFITGTLKGFCGLSWAGICPLLFFYILLTCMFDGFDLFSTLQCHFIRLSFLKVHFREVCLKLMGLYLVPGAKQVLFPVSDQGMGEMGEMLHAHIQWAAKPRILAYAPGKRLDWVGTIFASGIYFFYIYVLLCSKVIDCGHKFQEHVSVFLMTERKKLLFWENTEHWKPLQ